MLIDVSYFMSGPRHIENVSVAEMPSPQSLAVNEVINGRNCLDGEELLDNQDLCLLLKVAPRTLTRYRKKGILPFLMLDGRCYYRATDVHKLIREKTD